MNLKEKIGQMFLFGFNGLEIDDEIKTLIQEYKVGNFILFTRNIDSEEQVKKLCLSLKEETFKMCNINPFIASDEEGGSVTRLKKITGEYPSHLSLGIKNDKKTTKLVANVIGSNLLKLGINMNLAPLADINSNIENPVIGIRAFGDNKTVVTNMVNAMWKGYDEIGMLPVIKHFPGHGDTKVDSHYGLPKVNTTKDNLTNNELVPFIKCIEDGAKGIMVSHVIINSIDERYPASMSKKVITGLLRDELKYDGLIVTDCFEMGAIKDNFEIETSVVKSILAGADLIDISHTRELQIRALEAVKKAVEDETIPIEIIDRAIKRIKKVKKEIEKKENEMKKMLNKKVDMTELHKTLIRSNIKNKININREKSAIVSILPYSGTPAEDLMTDNLEVGKVMSELLGIDYYNFKFNLNKKEVEDIIKNIQNYDEILFFNGDMDIHKNQYLIYNEMKHKKIHLIDMRMEPKKLEFKPKTHTLVGGYTDLSVKALKEFVSEYLFRGEYGTTRN